MPLVARPRMTPTAPLWNPLDTNRLSSWGMNPDDTLYEAERSVSMMRYPTRFPDGESAAAFFEKVIGTQWFANRWPAVIKRNLVVKQSNHQNAYADFGNNTIYLPPWSLTDFTLLHEVAHFCAARERKEMHGPMFRAAHHALIGRFMSTEAARCYRYACLAHNLEF